MRSHQGRFLRLAAAAALAGAVALVGSVAQATTVTNGSGILDTFIGKNEDHPDLNAVSASATFDFNNVYLNATMAGAIGFTAANSDGKQQGVYVWGVNRGNGKAILNGGPNNLGTDTSTPIGGPDIKFDAFIVLQDLADGHGDGFVALIGDDGKVAGTFGLDASNISYSGNDIDLTLARSDLPGNGFTDFAQYGFNIWPRLNGLASNTLVASFLPGASNFEGSAVPEPASWAMMIAGFGMIGSTLRRRRVLAA